MTGYSVTPESSISSNWMDFVLMYALSFSIAYRLNLCMGFHPLLSPAIIHFTLIIMIGTLQSTAARCNAVKRKREKRINPVLFVLTLPFFTFQ